MTNGSEKKIFLANSKEIAITLEFDRLNCLASIKASLKFLIQKAIIY